MNEEEVERYEADLELGLYREYRDVLRMFRYAVETERRFYLANQVEVIPHSDPGGVWFEVLLEDAWVWDMFRPARFVEQVRTLSFRDVNVERLSHQGDDAAMEP